MSSGKLEEDAVRYKNLTLENRGHVCLLVLNRPPVNVWNWAMVDEFEKAIDEVGSDEDTRVLIITGGGEKCFSAGLDVNDAANIHKIRPKARETWMRIDRFSKPVIAAINGFALGGGLELALCCHFRIMVDDPRITVGLTELNLGIMPGWGGTQRLTRIVGKAKALDMILFSKKINAKEALQIGLIDQIAKKETLLDDAMALAETLAKRPPIAVGCVLKAISAFEYEGLEVGLKIEGDGCAMVAQSKDREEGFKAFLEKREPVFKGK